VSKSTVTANEVFSFLTPDEIKTISDSAATGEYKAGQIIYHKGLRADRVYVLVEGQVVLRVPSKQGVDIMVDQLGPGSMFGASAIMGRDYTVTAQCFTNCKILNIDIAAWQRIMNDNLPMAFAIEKHIAELYYQRYIDAMQKLEAIVKAMPLQETSI
jgi:CRP-like cAMP-binding protein